MIERRINRLNEEISRWAFEIKVESLPDWKIIFTNPTAGPWKKIMCFDEFENIGEVYRFQLEEERPDIVMINDELKAVVIIEAKDSLEKLIESSQMKKTVEVTEIMAKMFKSKSSNRYWGKRSEYKTYLGLLWGSDSPSSDEKITDLFKKHFDISKNKNDISDTVIIGIETIYNSDKNFMKCVPHYYYEDNSDEFIKSLIISLALIANL